jgi:hypothetical protein
MWHIFLSVTFALFVHSTAAEAGWRIPGSNICVGFGCSGEPIVNEWLKKRWDEIGEGPESAFRICREVDLETCSNIGFIQTYQALRLSAMARIFKSLDGCVAYGRTLNEFGHDGARLYMIAEGIPVPNEVLNVSQERFDKYTLKSCKVLYAGSVGDIARVTTSKGDIYAPITEVASLKSKIDAAPPVLVSLKSYHPGCDSVGKSQTAECVAAMANWCGANGGGAGISQEVGPNGFAVACIPSLSYTSVDIAALKTKHSGCDSIGKSRTAECVSAMYRWCGDHGGGAGFSQQVGPNGFGVACNPVLSFTGVQISELREYHPGCDSIGKSQTAECVSAMYRWCGNHGGGAGISQEVGPSGFAVACMPPKSFTGVPVQ